MSYNPSNPPKDAQHTGQPGAAKEERALEQQSKEVGAKQLPAMERPAQAVPHGLTARPPIGKLQPKKKWAPPKTEDRKNMTKFRDRLLKLVDINHDDKETLWNNPLPSQIFNLLGRVQGELSSNRRREEAEARHKTRAGPGSLPHNQSDLAQTPMLENLSGQYALKDFEPELADYESDIISAPTWREEVIGPSGRLVAEDGKMSLKRKMNDIETNNRPAKIPKPTSLLEMAFPDRADALKAGTKSKDLGSPYVGVSSNMDTTTGPVRSSPTVDRPSSMRNPVGFVKVALQVDDCPIIGRPFGTIAKHNCFVKFLRGHRW